MDKFTELIIPRSTVESLSHQEIGNLMLGFTWRLSLWKHPQKLIQMGFIQLIGAGIIFMTISIPLASIVSPLRDRSTNTSESIRAKETKSILINSLITLAISGAINGLIYQRGKRLQKLLKLVEKIEEYNKIVRSIEMLAKLTILTNPNLPATQIDSILDILTQTRNSLLAALKIDQHLREHDSTSELMTSFIDAAPATIAGSLIVLQHLANQPQLAEYATLLDRAWEIGMNIDREI